MNIVLRKSPKSTKKYRVILPNGNTVDFGARGYSDYTIHKNPLRMRLYVQRHGGNVPPPSGDVHTKMLKVTKSNKENWSLKGVDTAGFWSRWLLWSYPSMTEAKKFMKKKFDLNISDRST